MSNAGDSFRTGHALLFPTYSYTYLSSPLLTSGPTLYLTFRFSLAQIHWALQKKQNSTFRHDGVEYLIIKLLSS